MNRFQSVFQRTRRENRAALIGYMTAGDPDLERSYEIFDAACDAGLDVLEIGIPFSDPTADGPVIQRAARRALAAGMTLKRGIAMAARLRKRHDLPIVLFTYYNPIMAMSSERFVAEAIDAGIDGVLVVDLPGERADEIMTHVPDKDQLAFIRLIGPTTDQVRRHEILRQAEGFVYVVSRRGVTGSGEIDWKQLENEMNSLRQKTMTPLCIGFGITTPEDAKRAGAIADGVIVGSAIQRYIEIDPTNAAESVKAFIQSLSKALHAGKN